MRRLAPLSDGAADETLSEREGEVSRLMAGGFSNRDIGEMLGLGTGAVKEPRLAPASEARRARPHRRGLKALASRLAKPLRKPAF